MFPKEPENQVRNFMIWWNNTFIIDFWYRQKYKIAFNSQQHRELSPFDLLAEWEEDQITTLVKNNSTLQKQTEDYLKTGDWLVPKGNVKDYWDSVDWEEFDDK